MLNSAPRSQALPVPDSAWQVTPQLKWGSSPAASNRKALSVPARLQHGRGSPARPWQPTDHEEKGSETGRSTGGGYPWPVANRTRTSPRSRALRDQHFLSPEGGQWDVKIRSRTCCSNKSSENLQLHSLLQRCHFRGPLWMGLKGQTLKKLCSSKNYPPPKKRGKTEKNKQAKNTPDLQI